MKLLAETVQEVHCITEAKDGKKNLWIEGIFMQSEIQNRNGRIYPKNIMERAVQTYNENFVTKGRAVGELNHPQGPTINLDKVSHLITDLRFEGNNVIGKAKILDTPMGVIAKGLLEGGVQLGVSSRGMGSLVQREGKNYVGDDFQLATVDIVADPSAHDAFVNGIMENAEWMYDAASGNWVKQELVEEIVKKTHHKQIDEDAAVRELKNLLFKF